MPRFNQAIDCRIENLYVALDIHAFRIWRAFYPIEPAAAVWIRFDRCNIGTEAVANTKEFTFSDTVNGSKRLETFDRTDLLAQRDSAAFFDEKIIFYKVT